MRIVPTNSSDKVGLSERPLVLRLCKPHFAASDQTKGLVMQYQRKKAVLLVGPTNASRMMAVSPRKLWSMTFEDQPGLPYIRCGRLVRYPVDDLRRWIESQRKGGDAR